MVIRILVVISLLLPVLGFAKNGFDLSNAAVPQNLIRAGGPPKDGIPAINSPKFETAGAATWLNPDDRILGVSIEGDHRAYPISILNWHEIVNDVVGGQDIVVSFCPLCGTGMVFDAQAGEVNSHFGVSGLLFESDVLLYDQETQSLWSQIWMKAVSGPLEGETLNQIVADHTSWADWSSRYPNTKVLSRETGFSRDYSRNPYAGYEQRKSLYFPVQNSDDSLHTKSWVMGISRNGQSKAYPFLALAEKEGAFLDEFNGETLKIEFDRVAQVGRIWIDDVQIPTIQAYWFAWYAFHPETEVFER